MILKFWQWMRYMGSSMHMWREQNKMDYQERRQHLKLQNSQRNMKLYPRTNHKTHMIKKLFSSRNLRNVLESTKERYPWNFLAVEGLDIFTISVLTQNKMIVMMNKLAVIRKIKRVRPCTRRTLRKWRKTSIARKTVKMKR